MKKWTRWQDWTALAAGLVAALATTWVTPAGASVALMLIFGILLIVSGILNLAMPDLRWMQWAQGVLGALLFISPWIGVYATAMGAAWFSWICGIVAVAVTAMTLAPTASSRSHHGDVAHAH